MRTIQVNWNYEGKLFQQSSKIFVNISDEYLIIQGPKNGFSDFVAVEFLRKLNECSFARNLIVTGIKLLSI